HREEVRRGKVRRVTAGAVILVALLAAFGSGCTLARKTMEAPINGIQSLFSWGESKPIIGPVELQEELLRFSDNLTSTTVRAAMKLEKEGKPIPRRDLLTVWIAVATDVLATATGSNSLGNLVDMIVLTSAARMRIEEYWMPKVYGESARPMLEAYRNSEKEIWRLAEKAFTPSQRQELRNAIERWREEAKEQVTAPSAFAGSALVSKITESGRKESGSVATSVFTLLDIDPLAGLDPATRELAQTRLLAERAMFIGQRMPQIIQWHAELLAIRTAELPQVEQAISSTTQFAAAGDRVGRLAEELPGLLSSERKEIFRALAQEREQIFRSVSLERERLLASVRGEEPGLTNLSREIGLTFGEGARMAVSTETALKTFDGVMARFDKEPPERKSEAEPFRIRDYADTAAEIGRMSERLTTLLNALQPNLSPEAIARLATATDTIAAKTEARGKAVVDYAFQRCLQLLAVVLAAALAYRLLVARMIRPR
ncbi:MAG: hypothetical protein H6R26_3003, partial [Proteobacteria bacterium]|nr:hypothetical protein [Pseudomonadota bacterium]